MITNLYFIIRFYEFIYQQTGKKWWPMNDKAKLDNTEIHDANAEDEEVAAEQAEDGDASADGDAPDAIGELEDRLEKAQEDVRAEHDRYTRLYAEFENYKKRSSREMQEFRKFANENLIRELLPVIDNLERAIQSSDTASEGSCILQGVDMTLKEIMRVLERFNVQPVEALGQPFDPNYHEAVGQEESDTEEDNIVVKEFQKGYLLHNRLIRPAMVIVSKAKPKTETGESGQDEHTDENA